ncbi:hypothetical protein F5B17DRAFT_262497 [Nemania serpens]|nr:hypothetical protein F5B17DRAFT_262497 [Nemania serpens]
MAENAQNPDIKSTEIHPPPPAYTDRKQTSPEEGNVPKEGPAPATSPAHLYLPQNAEGYVAQDAPSIIYVVVTPLAGLTAEPAWIDCPFCHTRAMTRIETEGTGAQVCCGIVLCLIFLPLACLPCIFHSFENTLVFCSACNRRVATVTYDGQVQIAPQPLPQPLPQQQPTQ